MVKLIKRWLDRIGDWAENYAWVVPAFALGIPFGLLVLTVDIDDRNFTLAVLTAVGTLGAAGAALWTTRLSYKTLNRQQKRDDALRQPNLVLSKVEIEEKKYVYESRDYYRKNPWGRYTGEFSLDMQLTNLGEFPIYVKGISTSSSDMRVRLLRLEVGDDFIEMKYSDDEEYMTFGDHEKPYDERGYLIPPNETVRRVLHLTSIIPTYQEAVKELLTISFQYGPTANELHRLELQTEIMTLDEDHTLVGYLEIRNGDEVDEKRLDIDRNYDRRMYSESYEDGDPY